MQLVVAIEFAAGQDLPGVEHDSDQIHQVLLNLLLNSVQSIEGPGVVKVALFKQGDEVVVGVADTGRGIPAAHHPNIFRPFYTAKGNGTGLGLSLARRIVEDHHGQIEVSSSADKGTTFSVRLPARQPVAAAS